MPDHSPVKRTPVVLFVTSVPLHFAGGIQTVAVRLLEGLTERGWRVEFLVARSLKRDRLVMETTQGAAVDLQAFLTEQRIDVVVNHHSFEVAFSRAFARLGRGARLVNVFHSTPAGGMNRFQAGNWLAQLRQRRWRVLGAPRLVLYPAIYWLKMRAVRNTRRLRFNHDVSDRYVVLSSRFFPEFKRRTGVVDLAKVRAISNPLRYDRVEPAGDRRERIFLVVARLKESEKRLSRVLRLWSDLGSGRGTGWRLVIVGEGPDRANYERLARELRLENLVFAGAVKDPQPYYQRASALLLTSAYEGFAMVLVEAMQHGVPPVVLDTFASLRDVVVHEENGLIVPDGDPAALVAAVRRLMEDEPLRQRLARNGPASVRRLELPRILDQWEALLNETAALP